MGNNPTLSVVVPIYNEADNLEHFYFRVRKVLDNMNISYEIICVNDGSTDGTLPKLKNLNAYDNNIKIISFSRNFGKELALTAGIDFARGDAVIPIDADLQDPPEIIPELVAKWREGYDVVYATRNFRDGETWLKRWTAGVFYRIINRLTHIQIPRDTGDFRLVSRCAVDSLKACREYNRFMKGLFAWVGYKQAAVFYKREPRHAGKTKWNYWKLWNLALEGITSFSNIPLQFATYFGLIVSGFSFLYALFIVAKTLLLGNPVPGYPSLITVILFLGGVQLFTIGILGEYVGRIYNEVKRRPLYIVQELIGFDEMSSIGKIP